jgi:hypothetical protein
MNEKLLQYLWNFKVFSNFDFKDTHGNPIEILNFGRWNTDSGPDFLMATIKAKNVILVGNIELHVKSSDWIFHQHTHDPNYQNIILHVVFQHDVEIEEFTDKDIPTLELINYIDERNINKYKEFTNGNQFISCEHLFTPNKIPVFFHEENILKKLQEKSVSIEQDLEKTQNNFEAVFFHHLAYSFGLKVNAFIFKQIAESIDFSIINKIRQNKIQLEALFFGISGWLEKPIDTQMHLWKREFDFLTAKFQLPAITIHPKFLRLRPPNFPTIRLSQLADLYFQHQNLFSKMILAQSSEELYEIFNNIKASEYWDDKFNFGKKSTINQPKMMSKEFINLIILNTVLPIKYTYHKYHHEEISDEIINFYKGLPPEKNTVIKNWEKLKMKTSTALETQSLIYHFKSNCEKKNCLNCGIGFKILKEI